MTIETKPLKKGAQLFHDGRQIGGLSRSKPPGHLFILSSYVERLPNSAEIDAKLQQHGFSTRKQQTGSPQGRHWYQISANKGKLFDSVIAEITGEAPPQYWRRASNSLKS